VVLRSVTTRHARRIARALRSRPLHLVANPVVALVLNVGGMAVCTRPRCTG
jgi:putative membrane protein